MRSILSLLFLFSVLMPFSVHAAPDACDYSIEGVTLDNTLEEASAIWISRGFTEVPREKFKGVYRSPPTFKRNAETLTYVDNKRGLQINYREASVNVAKPEREERVAAMMARTKAAYAKFCPSGTVISSREHICPPVENDGSLRYPTTISVNPDGQNVCQYNLFYRSGVSETLKRVINSTPKNKGKKFMKKGHLSTY